MKHFLFSIEAGDNKHCEQEKLSSSIQSETSSEFSCYFCKLEVVSLKMLQICVKTQWGNIPIYFPYIYRFVQPNSESMQNSRCFIAVFSRTGIGLFLGNG